MRISASTRLLVESGILLSLIAGAGILAVNFHVTNANASDIVKLKDEQQNLKQQILSDLKLIKYQLKIKD